MASNLKKAEADATEERYLREMLAMLHESYAKAAKPYIDRLVAIHAMPKRDSFAMWGNLLVAHAWAAACYVRPGWFPAAVSLVSILLAALILYEDKITAAIVERADDEHA
jgi:hypothetical protein